MGLGNYLMWRPVHTTTAIVAVCCGVAALVTYLIINPLGQPIPAGQGSVTVTQQSNEARNGGPAKPIRTKAPPKALPPTIKAPLALPPTVQADPDSHVLASVKIQAEARPYTISAVLDGQGDTTIYARPDPLPLIAITDTGAVGVAYGVREDGRQVGMLHGRVDVLRLKGVHAGAIGTIDTTGRAFAGLNMEIRF